MLLTNAKSISVRRMFSLSDYFVKKFDIEGKPVWFWHNNLNMPKEVYTKAHCKLSVGEFEKFGHKNVIKREKRESPLDFQTTPSTPSK
jgi:hypothetical protein